MCVCRREGRVGDTENRQMRDRIKWEVDWEKEERQEGRENLDRERQQDKKKGRE